MSFLKIVVFKIARNTQKMRILRGKVNQDVIFCVQHFFQNLLLKLIFFFKIMLSKNLIFLEKLTRREIFISKSDAL